MVDLVTLQLCVCVCVYVCIYLYDVYMCVSMHILTCVCVHIFTCMYVCVYVCLHVTYTCMYVCVRERERERKKERAGIFMSVSLAHVCAQLCIPCTRQSCLSVNLHLHIKHVSTERHLSQAYAAIFT
jgi:hypothetical protein